MDALLSPTFGPFYATADESTFSGGGSLIMRPKRSFLRLFRLPN